MTTDSETSPSAVITSFVEAAKKDFPETELAKLDAHADAIAATTTHHDAARATMCAAWAVITTDEDTPRFGIWHSFVETGHVIGASLSHNAEENLAETAVAVAVKLGAQIDWSEIPWEDLLTKMIALDNEPAPADAADAGIKEETDSSPETAIS